MAIQEDLIYFLKNGKLKNINYAITRSQLTDILGEPNFVLPQKARIPTMYEYDVIEFYFEDESNNARLKNIQVNHPNSYSNEGNLLFKDYGWTTDLRFKDAINFLNKNEIEVQEKPHPIDLFRCFVTKSGVHIYFTNQNEDETIWTLYSFGRSIEFTSPTRFPIKQIGLEIELKYYEMLRKKAEKTKISIANQCREIIENYLKKQNKK